ncbi:hypothetical protein PGQ11_011846 [Apiospora arundinis]|uniref:Xylanolytic transcriptional activator regulatory domain-containing protein n=1 Tax=Apiospora arundinis TaxID=335852 RepID=A0ABR2I0Q4_9PEZI
MATCHYSDTTLTTFMAPIDLLGYVSGHIVKHYRGSWTRKLRCSRTSPCSNCVSRGIACDLEHPVARMSNSSNDSNNPDNSEIISRLQRLESILAPQSDIRQSLDSQQHDTPESQPGQPVQPLPLALQHPIFNDQPGHIKIPGIQIVLRICPVAQITNMPTSRGINTRGPAPIAESESSRCIRLPPRPEAQLLLDKFTCIAPYIPYHARVSFLPSVLEQVYSAFLHQRQIPSGHLILLLSVIATATHFWTHNDNSNGLFPTPAVANDQAPLWVKALGDVLDIVRRTPGDSSIECVQGAICAEFVAARIDGLHASRVFSNIGLGLARDLGLHRIDHPSNAEFAITARAEIGRRIWWYICASDWDKAVRVGGMGEGIYSCHPRQMITRKPLHINDDQLFDGMSRDERPLSEPTTMSYFMQRIRLSEVSRSIVDRSPLSMAHTSGLSHDAVMAIDTELQTLINEVPAFYSMSERELIGIYRLSKQRAEVTIFQGMTIYLYLFLQRCKLHFPYLTSRPGGPEYYLSREICIKSARLIVQSELWQKSSSDHEAESRFKFTELLSGVFCACIILLVNLSVNPKSAEYDTQRDEVYRSFKIIEEAKNGSEASARFVDMLMQILQKHNEPRQDSAPTQPKQQQHQQAGASSLEEMALNKPNATAENGDRGKLAFPEAFSTQAEESGGDLDLNMVADEPLFGYGGDLSSFWDEFTQSFRQGNDVGGFDWDKIFAELDSSFV